MSIYRKIKNEKDHWITIQFKIPFNFLVKKLKGNIQSLHRLICNGQGKLTGIANRDFWKEIFGGYFRYFFTHRYIHFVYHIKTIPDQLSYVARQIQIRIGKIIPVQVKIVPFELMDEVDVMLLSLPKGISNYRKIKFR